MEDDGFPEVVKRFMEQRSMGIRALARVVHYDAGYLSKVVRGLKDCGPDLARLVDQALGADGEIISAAVRRVPGLDPPASRVPVAPELAGYFATQLAGHYMADRFLGPRRLIPAALAQYELLCDVAADARGSLRADLWSIAAGFAGLLGWLYQDAGNLAVSGRWHDAMIERAHRSQDVNLLAFTLHCKAMMLADMGDGPGVLDLASAGLRQTRNLCAKPRIILLQQYAHGISLADADDAADQCARLLDEAESLVGSVDDEYPWGANCQTPRYVDVQRATIWTRLGRTREALNLWGEIIPDIPPSSRRDLGVYLARQAQALAAAGEPEQAVEIAREAVPLAAQTGSARMRGELAALRGRMKPWRSDKAGRALENVLAGIERKG
jgi:tetratricopeptide (TPR) repeat protein